MHRLYCLYCPAGAFVFFVIFVLVCALILINLYMGIIFSNFSRITEQVCTAGACTAAAAVQRGAYC